MSSKGLGRGLDALLRRTDMAPPGRKRTIRRKKRRARNTAPPCCPCPICMPIPASPARPSTPNPWPNWRPPSVNRASSSPCWCAPWPTGPATTRSWPVNARWRAARQAGLGQVPVHVREMSDAEVMAAALIENLQREDLNPMEEAQALQQLRETLKLTQEALAARLGKSRPAIANALRLLQLSPAAQADLHHGRLSAGHARCLLALGNDERALAAAEVLRSHIISESLSVRQAEEAVALWREEQRLPWTAASEAAPQRPAPCKRKKLPQIAALQKSLCAALPCKARVSGDMESGRITLRYTSPQELEALLNRLHCHIPEDEPAGEAIAAPVDAKTPRQ